MISVSSSTRISLAFLCLMLSTPATAENNGLQQKLHPWGRFEPGAWKLVRVVTELFDEQGRLTSVSTADTKTTLSDIDDESVTLMVETCWEVAGKRFQSEPQTVRQGFHGESLLSGLTLKELTDGSVVIEGRKIPCKVQHLEVRSANEKTAVRLFFSPNLPPYILRRESTVSEADGERVLGQTEVEVIALEMPVKVRGLIKTGAYLKTTQKNDKGTALTLTVFVPDVPGGVVGYSLKESNHNGKLVRRSSLELVDYGVEPESERAGIFNRKRAARRAK